MSEKLTVLIPCKNEGRNIGPCIASVRGIADEILVADSGSTDDTPQVVDRMGGCRVIEREFVGYASFKNWAIPQARHDWVLIVDADERMTNELEAEIRAILVRPEDDIDGYWIPFRCFFMGHPVRYSGWNTRACRLIRRDKCRYKELNIHEEIDIDSSRTRKLEFPLNHFSYWSYDQYFGKYVKYTRLGAVDMWERGKRVSYSSMLLRPMLRFLQLYFLKRGFLDGIVGLQICILTAFFNTFVKQARLWEMEHARSEEPEPKVERLEERPAA